MPEQLFYIDGKSADEYMRGIPEYADLTPDYSPDSEYLRILRAEIISATMGSVSPVDIAVPEVDPVSGQIRCSRVRELRVDYSIMEAISTWRDENQRRVYLRDRQNSQWTGAAPTRSQNLTHIYPEMFTAEARSQRQAQIIGNIEKNLTPVIRLAGSQEGGLTQQQREACLEIRRLEPADGFMDVDAVENALSVYNEITRQLGLGQEEAGMLIRAGVIASETEMFYIDGVPAREYLGVSRASLRDSNGNPNVSDGFDQVLKARIAAAAISGRHIVEVGRVVMDEAGRLKAGVMDVHVDLEPIRMPGDDPECEQNAALRASRANRNQEERRSRIHEEMQARIDRAREITYTDRADRFYRAAAQRFDRNRPDMTDAYISGTAEVGNMIRQWRGNGISDSAASRMVSSLAQMYLLAQNPDIHLIDLADPNSLKAEKAQAGRAVTDALRKATSNGNWEDFDAILASVNQMVHPMKPEGNQSLPEALKNVRYLDMKEELAAVMEVDLKRRPAYSQAEFLRLMDSPENSPRVSALLGLAGSLAGDTGILLSPRMAGSARDSLLRSDWSAQAYRVLYDIDLIGRNERAWLETAQNYRRREDAFTEALAEEAADRRLSMEDARRIVAGNGIRYENRPQIEGILNQEIRPRIRQMGRELSGQLVRDLAERPFADLGLTDTVSPAVKVTIPGQFDNEDLGNLVNLASQNQSLDPAGDGMTIAYASMMFDQMFSGGPDAVFGGDYRRKLENEGMDPMDRIYIEGRSVNDLYREKYGDLLESDRSQAIGCMKTEFMIRMLQGARIDVAAEQNGVEIVSAMALQTDIREISRRAWLAVPQGAEKFPQFVDSLNPQENFTVPPMTAEMLGRIHASQWAAADRAVRGTEGPVPAPEAEQRGPEAENARRLRQERMEAGRTGMVPDSEWETVDLNLKGRDDVRNRLFRLYSDGEGQLKRIFEAEQPDADAVQLMDSAADMVDNLIRDTTYIHAPKGLGKEDKVIPTRLQQQMGYGPGNMTEMFFIDGLSVDEYAKQHGMGNAVAKERPDRENNRKAILAAAFLSGGHHVDMIRVGLVRADDYDMEGNALRRARDTVYGDNYKTGIIELQADLSDFDGMERFYQRRPSRRAEQFYGDGSGREQRHRRLKQTADETLYTALTRIRRNEESLATAAGGGVAAAAVADQIRQPEAQPVPVQPVAQAAAAQPPAAQQTPQQTPAPQTPVTPQQAQPTSSQPPAAQQPPQTTPPQTPSAQQPLQPTPPQPAQPRSVQTPPAQQRTQTTSAQLAQTRSTQTPPAQPRQTAPAQPPARTSQLQPAPAPRLTPAPQPQPVLHRPMDDELAIMLWDEGSRVLCHEDRRPILGHNSALTDKAWLRFGDFRRSLADRAGMPAPQDGRVLEGEYKALADLFERMETEDFSSTQMSPDVPDTIRHSSYKKFRRFLSDVTKVLESDDPDARQRAQKRVTKTLNGLLPALGRIRFPYQMDFADSEKIVDRRQEFINLANVTRVLRDIEKAVYPNRNDDSMIEATHNVFDAAVKVYDDEHIENFHDGFVSRYILDQVYMCVNVFIARGESIGFVMDSLKQKYGDEYNIVRKPDEIVAKVDSLLEGNENQRNELIQYYVGKDRSDRNAKTPMCPIDHQEYHHGLPPSIMRGSAQRRQEEARQVREEKRMAERQERLPAYREAQRIQAEKRAERWRQMRDAENRNTYDQLCGRFRKGGPIEREFGRDREYSVLAGLFSQVTDVPSWSLGMPILLSRLGEEKELSGYQNEMFRQFLSNLGEALDGGMDPEKREAARNKVNKALNKMEQRILSSVLPNELDFSDPEQIAAHADELGKLRALTGIMLDIDGVINPPDEERCRDLRAIHSICTASVIVYNDKFKFEERCLARYILDQIPGMMRVTTPAQQQNVILDRDKIGGLLSNDRIGFVLGRADQEMVWRIGSDDGLSDAMRNVSRALRENAAGMADYYNGRNVRGKLEEAGVRCPVDDRIYVHSEAPKPEVIGKTNPKSAEKKTAAGPEASANPNRRRAAELLREIHGGSNSKPAEKKETSANPRSAEKKEAGPAPKPAQEKETAPKPETSENPNRHLAVGLQDEIRGGSKPKPAESKRSENPEQKPAEKKEPMEKKGPAEKKPPEKAPAAGGMK